MWVEIVYLLLLLAYKILYWVTGLDIVIMKHFRKSDLSDKRMKNDKFSEAFNWRFIKYILPVNANLEDLMS